MKFFLWMFLLVPSIASADLNCPVQLFNAGPVHVEGSFIFTGFPNSDTSFRFQVIAEPGDIEVFDPPSQVATTDNPQYTIGFTAPFANTTIQTTQFSGVHGWACVIEITSITVLPSDSKQVKKQNARDKVSDFTKAGIILDGTAGGLAIIGQPLLAVVALAQAKFFQWQAVNQQKIADAPDPEPVWHSAEDLGFTWITEEPFGQDYGVGYYTNLLISDAVQLDYLAQVSTTGTDVFSDMADVLDDASNNINSTQWLLNYYGFNAVDPDSGSDWITLLQIELNKLSELGQEYRQ